MLLLRVNFLEDKNWYNLVKHVANCPQRGLITMFYIEKERMNKDINDIIPTQTDIYEYLEFIGKEQNIDSMNEMLRDTTTRKEFEEWFRNKQAKENAKEEKEQEIEKEFNTNIE